MMLHQVLVLLHILAMAVWIAAAMWVAGDVKRALSMGKPFVDALPARVRPALGLDAIAGLATIGTGALLVWNDHMTRPPVGITVGMALAFVRLGVLAGIRRSWRGILARIQAGQPVPADDPAARRMAMLSGIAHTAWLVALAGMVLPV